MESASCAIQERVGSLSLRFGSDFGAVRGKAVQLYVRYTCDQASIGTCSYADGIVHLGLTSAYYRPTVPALAAM